MLVGSSTPRVENGFVAGVRMSFHSEFDAAELDCKTVVLVPAAASSASKSSRSPIGFSARESFAVTSAASSSDHAVVTAAGVGAPVTAAIKCSRNSSAVWKRSWRSFARPRNTTASSAGEIDESNWDGGMTASETCW